MAIPFLTEDISNKIEELADGSIAIFGTTAFWTIHPDFFRSPKFLEILSQEKSFFVVDISEPTIVENVIACADKGANIYIYLKRAKDTLYKYNHLLHSKIILFEYDSGYSLLIGSANMTSRAIKGINREAGVQINLSKSAVLLHEVLDYLTEIKRNSIKVDPSKMDLYKFIQNQDNLDNHYENCPMLYLAAQNEEYSKMITGTVIQLLGLNDKFHHFYSKLETHHQRIALLIENINTNETKVCVCSLKSTGEVDLHNPETYQKDYDERLLFYIGLTEFNGASTPSFIYPASKIQKQMFYIADFHAELLIDELYSNIYFNEYSIKDLINPWIREETIQSHEDGRLDQQIQKSSENIKPFNKNKKYNAKIHFEKINMNFFKEGYYEKITSELTPSKLKLENINPPVFYYENLHSANHIQTLISDMELNAESRENTIKEIEKLMVQNYNSLEKERRTTQRNIRLFKPSLIHKIDRIEKNNS
jgi:hypothetical protein